MTEHECEDCPFWVETDDPPDTCPVCGSEMRKVNRWQMSRRLLDKLKNIVRNNSGRNI